MGIFIFTLHVEIPYRITIRLRHNYAFMIGDVLHLQNYLQRTVMEVFSFNDVTKTKQESFYHGFLLGLSLAAKSKYVIKSNRESGYGRYDIAWYPKDCTQYPGIVIEMKVDANSAQSALAQIDTKKYEADLLKYGCKDIVAYGIHCDGKRIRVTIKE